MGALPVCQPASSNFAARQRSPFTPAAGRYFQPSAPSGRSFTVFASFASVLSGRAVSPAGALSLVIVTVILASWLMVSLSTTAVARTRTFAAEAGLALAADF